MENYVLKEDEVVLFKTDTVKVDKLQGKAELTLTNHSIVLDRAIRSIKKMFSKPEHEILILELSSVKIYNNVPQIKLGDSTEVEVYLIDGEHQLDFNSRSDAKKFVNAVVEILTGMSAVRRGADKVKGAVGLVDDTLGINSVQTVVGVLENGIGGGVIGLLGGKKLIKGWVKSGINQTSKKTEKGEVVKEGAGVAMEAVSAIKESLKKTDANETKQEQSYEEKIEVLKKLKVLVDDGIITEEEFELKKREILNI